MLETCLGRLNIASRFIALKKHTTIILVAVVLIVIFFAFKSFTPPISSEGSISQLKSMPVNGDSQFLLIRGHNKNLPVLLFLHGGPGMPAMYLAHDFQRELEKHFLVVHWDQRGAGKSYKAGIDPATLKISTLLDDTDVVVDHLIREFGVNSLWLVGHSHGSYLGVLYARRHPEKVTAYVGLGQIGDFERIRPVQDAFLRSRFSSLNLPGETEFTSSNREDLLFRTGSELYSETSFMPLVISGIMATEYSVFDVLNVKKGSSFSSEHMVYDMNKDLIGGETSFEMPIAIVMGATDMTTPVILAKEYYEAITAPDKRFVIFPEASHFPHFEQPELFLALMLDLKKAWN